MIDFKTIWEATVGKTGIDWSKKDVFNGIGRPDLRPKDWVDKDQPTKDQEADLKSMYQDEMR